MENLLDKFKLILDFVYPPCCIVCDVPMPRGERIVCEACWNQLRHVKGVVEEGIVERSYVDEIRSGVYYTASFETIIHHFKYQRAIILSEKFSEILAEIILNIPAWRSADWLIPIPLHLIKRRERSYNQSEEICKALSRRVPVPYRRDIVRRIVNTVSQTKMPTAAARVENMHEVFVVEKPSEIKAKTIILVDDLITTGATANSCARALKQAGADRVYVLTVARPMLE